MAAQVALAGVDPLRFLEATDPVEVAIMISIARHWQKLRLQLEESLANQIINALSKAMKG
jgi:hypothetical protein